MAKTILGVDIGHDSLKLALVKGNTVCKTALAQMPQDMVRNGSVISNEAMGELIRKTMKENGIRSRSASMALHNDSVFIMNVNMPLMNIKQLEYNLPFEFRDYITDELKNYIFDYAVISDHATVEETDENGNEKESEVMELMAVAAPAASIEDAKEIMRKSSMKLVKAAPSVCAFQSIIRELNRNGADPSREYCILDMGYSSIRMYIFRGDKHVVSRALEIGMRNIDQVLADAYSVDEHLAHTYLLTNYENCQSKECCINAYNSMAVELMRAVNFYQFSNPDSHLEDVWICGGGACIEPLRSSITESLDMNIHPASELVPGAASIDMDYSLIQAIGIALN